MIACVHADSATAETRNSAPAGYRLVWADEFNKDPDGLPDPTKWSYEVGLIRNNEAQYYTTHRLQNARVEKGHLIIEGRKESFSNPSLKQPRMAKYTSAALETIGKADWLYGRIEVCAKLPEGKGVWPAIWMLGSDGLQWKYRWPRCGEIDIMELVGKQPGVIHGTIHYFVDHSHASQKAVFYLDHPESDFHVYAAEWTPDHISLFVDDQKYLTFAVSKASNKGQNPFQKPQYLILNLALGGDWGGPIDDSIFPQRMTVDYVRVYQKNQQPSSQPIDKR